MFMEVDIMKVKNITFAVLATLVLLVSIGAALADRTEVTVNGTVNISEDAQDLMDQLVDSLDSTTEYALLSVEFGWEDNATTTDEEVVGNLTTEQQELWDDLKEESAALIGENDTLTITLEAEEVQEPVYYEYSYESDGGAEVSYEGTVNVSEEAQDLIDDVVASIEGGSGDIKLEITLEEDGNETTDYEDVEGNLTEGQQDLWDDLKAELESLLGDGDELTVRIEYNAPEDEIDDDTTDEVGDFIYPYGAKVRLLQLEKSISRNILIGEAIVDYLDNNSTDVSSLEDILLEMELLQEELQDLIDGSDETNMTSSELAQQFVYIKKEAVTLSQQFRKEVWSLVAPGFRDQLKRRVNDAVKQSVEQFQEQVQERIRTYNADRLQEILDDLGIEGDDWVDKVLNGEMTVKEVLDELEIEYDGLSLQQQSQFRQKENEHRAERSVHALATIQSVREQIKERLEIRREERKTELEAKQEAQKARLQAQKEAQTARLEAQKEAAKTRLELIKSQNQAMRDRLKQMQELAKEQREERREALKERLDQSKTNKGGKR